MLSLSLAGKLPCHVHWWGRQREVSACTCRMSASSATLARADVATNTAYRMISIGSALSSFRSLSLLLTNPCSKHTHMVRTPYTGGR